MKKGLLFLNGEPPQKSTVLNAVFCSGKQTYPVYCTDGAYGYLSKCVLPNTVAGDFDSFDKALISDKCEVITYPPEKDFTDGFLALNLMIERGFTHIDIYGAFGGRADMAETNLYLPVLALKKGVCARLLGNLNVYAVNAEFKIKMQKGKIFSLVPFTDSVHILYTKGLKYPLKDYTLSKFDELDSPKYVMGVSNESVQAEVELKVSGGVALAFVEE